MATKKKKGVGPTALRKALNGINSVSEERRRLLPGLIEYELRQKFPMKRIKY